MCGEGAPWFWCVTPMQKKGKDSKKKNSFKELVILFSTMSSGCILFKCNQFLTKMIHGLLPSITEAILHSSIGVSNCFTHFLNRTELVYNLTFVTLFQWWSILDYCCESVSCCQGCISYWKKGICWHQNNHSQFSDLAEANICSHKVWENNIMQIQWGKWNLLNLFFFKKNCIY